MRALGMTSQIRDGRFYRIREPRHVPALQGLDNPAEDVHGTHRHLACGPGHLKEELGHMSQNRLSAAAAMAAQISPSTIAGCSVSKACSLAEDFHSLPSNSPCHLHV